MAEAISSSYSSQDDQELSTATFFGHFPLYKPDGRFWFYPQLKETLTFFQTELEARDGDVFLASYMKTGTTWLKALSSYIILNPEVDDVLANANPHAYVTTVDTPAGIRERDLAAVPSPRILHTHFPYEWWPDSVKNSGCKVVYITRNPKDTFVSMWNFFNTLDYGDPDRQVYPLEKAFEEFCDGVVPYGPFFDHVTGFWDESLKMPIKVLFLRYEELKRDTRRQVKRLAEFLGKPFGSDEDVDRVIWRSSFERLKNLEANNGNESVVPMVPNNLYFRRGVVGDWRNYFTDQMQKRLDQITLSKFHGSGLHLDDV